MQIAGFYEYFEERPLDGPAAARRRNVAGSADPYMTLEAAQNAIPSDYVWWKTRELEGRTDAPRHEGVWGINYWRAEKHLGDPTVYHLPMGTDPSDWPADIAALARRYRLHHYFRVWDADECRRLVIADEEVRFGCEVTEDWFDPPGGRVADPPPGEPVLGTHAVPLVAYDHRADRFCFPNSWGPDWGDNGRGSVSRAYFDRHLVEAGCRIGQGVFPPLTARNGLVTLLWKSSHGGEGVHGREVVDAGSGDRIAWAFAVRRAGHLEVEELFVWPKYRRQGYGRRLTALLRELAEGMRLPIRAWVPFADCDGANRPALLRVLGLLGLHLHPSPRRSAGFVGLGTVAPPPAEPKLPGRPASIRDRLNPEAGTRLYTVWYATNRRPADPADSATGFSGERDDRTHYGRCQVAIPRSHQFGSVGSAWWRRWARWADDRLHLVTMSRHDGEDFWADLRSTLSDCPAAERQALVFLHGYRVPFDRAVVRAAQIGFDLKVPGVTAVFSWPSRGRTLEYAGDGEAIQASETAIVEFLTRLVNDSGATRVHLIAHSMGNRGLLRAVQRLAAVEGPVRFGQIVLAAPDVDHDLFRELATVYPAVSDRTTLYVSPSDRAVMLSRRVHNSPRVGLSPPVTVVEGIDTVVVPRFDLMDWGWHSYFAEAEGLLHDMYDLIRRNPDPSSRLRLQPRSTEAGHRYWTMI